MPKILVLHGPNLNLLGDREVSVYGTTSIDDINKTLIEKGKGYGFVVESSQSNHEGEIVDAIGQAKKKGYAAVIINPAAYTHTSIAIRDAISASGLLTVEVHLSNIYAREEFRHTSLSAPVVKGQISGFGPMSYVLALEAVINMLNEKA